MNDQIDKYINRSTWQIKENANTGYSFSGLQLNIAENAIKDYVLDTWYKGKIAKAYNEGYFHIHDLGFNTVYSYYGKETLTVQYKGELLHVSFENLYDLVKEDEEVFNEKDGAFVKYTSDLMALDKDGWVYVEKVIKKARTNKFKYIKLESGEGIIVTDNHPIVTKDGDIVAENVTEGMEVLNVNKKFHGNGSSVQVTDLISDLNVDGKNSNYIIQDDSLVRLYKSPSNMKNYQIIDYNFGYLLGIICGEGSFNKNNLNFCNSNEKILERCINYLKLNRISFNINTRSGTNKPVTYIDINNSLFVKFVKQFVTSGNFQVKRLKGNFLQYNKEYLKGFVAGFIDAEGTKNSNSSVLVRVANRDLVNQIAFICRNLGIHTRDYVPYFNNKAETSFKSNFTMFGLTISLSGDNEKLNTVRFQDQEQNDYESKYKYGWNKITKVKDIKIDDDVVYDITTDTRHFICNGMYSHNCLGHSLQQLLEEGFNGIQGKVSAGPPKHLRTAVNQMVNFLFTLQSEAAGAQAFSNVDTLLAPYVKKDKLDYKEVQQCIQEFVYSMNVPNRVGFQAVFSNVTFDIHCPKKYSGKHPNIGGKEMEFTYEECDKEIGMISKAFFEIMMKGDAEGKPFTFPIPTVNLHKDFVWDDDVAKVIFEATAKYGIPNFQNFINSDLGMDDSYSMCCRLKIDLRELEKKTGGIFGAGEGTGSINVVTINLPLLAYEANDEEEFFKLLDKYMELAKDVNEIKRKHIVHGLNNGLVPYSKRYIKHFNNHFSTIATIGGNELCLNLLGKSLEEKESQEFIEKMLKHMGKRLSDFQEETGNLYNLEQAPAEGASYKLAVKSINKHPDIKHAGTDTNPYFTNSTHLPVNHNQPLMKMLKVQERFNDLYNGGNIVHIYLGQKVPDWINCMLFVRKIAEKTRLPFYTITPKFSICPVHGYISGEHEFCPLDHSKEDLEKHGIKVEYTTEENKDE